MPTCLAFVRSRHLSRQQASRPFRKHLVVLLQIASGSAAVPATAPRRFHVEKKQRRGADPLRQKRAHAQRPASRADRRLWFALVLQRRPRSRRPMLRTAGDRAAPPGSGTAAMLRRGQLRPRQLARNCPRRGHRSRATIAAGTGGLPIRNRGRGGFLRLCLRPSRRLEDCQRHFAAAFYKLSSVWIWANSCDHCGQWAYRY